MHAGNYAFAGRRIRRRDMRKLWIVRLNAALRAEGTTYSKFLPMLKAKKVDLNRKMLSELAINNPEAFKSVFKFITS
jgi:large subunit ribosomal protein L20